MITRLLEGMIIITLVVFIHGVGSLIFLRLILWYRPFWERHGTVLVNTLSLTWIVGLLIVLHLWEIWIFALYYYSRGVLPDLETCAYYSLLTYTTVGYGDVVLPKAWRLIGTSEALVGILMSAWSTALLIGVVNAFHGKTLEFWKQKDRERNPAC